MYFMQVIRKKLNSRTKSTNHRKWPSRSSGIVRQKPSSRMRSPKREKSRSLSPRSKRLKLAKSERDAEKGSERELSGVTLLFNEPPDARKPEIRWRLYVFKGTEALTDPLYVHRQSCYLFGRQRRVADIPTVHPSCSKQHSVLQYRQVEEEKPDGTVSKQVRPYLMDLGSTNGTFIDEWRLEPQRYYKLFEKDTIKFGNSSREYVLLHENSEI